MYRFGLHIAAVVLLGLTFTACSDDDPAQPAEPVVYQGQSAALGEGQVRVWEKADADGNLMSVGVTFDESVLTGLPQAMTMLDIPLPRKVGTSPFTKIGFDWNPQGHEPAPLYTAPHFDVHFYTVTDQQLAAVIPGPDTVAVDPMYLPSDYMSTGDAIPNMGTHWVDTTSGEFHGAAFDKTFIYGYYRGDLFFLEPMITKAFFESKPDMLVDIKQPAANQMTGKAFPMQYRISYNPTAGEYTVELTSMQVR
ncbi:MAG: DUF5602 domain-containing protein [Bacteroidetes bacterium]|nr:DUF5602 domain-containing protein [Bacteroidota bacterium]